MYVLINVVDANDQDVEALIIHLFLIGYLQSCECCRT